jgi:hypothetical protein
MEIKENLVRNVLNYVFVAVAGAGLVGLGFWFGIKYQLAAVNKTGVASYVSSTPVTSEKAIKTLEIEGVWFIKAGEKPECPENYLIKGKFADSGTGYYYTKESKTFDRVKPQICFATEEVAKTKAGFVKKY